MKTKIKNAVDSFLDEEQEKKDVDFKKIIKSDNSIIERLDRIIIAENGKQLLREQY